MFTPERRGWSGWSLSRKSPTAAEAASQPPEAGAEDWQPRDGGALAARVEELEKELYEYQYSMGLLLIEKKEWSSKSDELIRGITTAEEILKQEQAAHLAAVSEFGKREEKLHRALGVEKQCVADLEKALREMRAEIAEVKYTSEKKLTDAHALEATIEEKYLEIESKLRSADAKLAEASRKSSGTDRKLEDVEACERKLQRDILSLNAEQKAHEKALAEQRNYLRDWENKLQESHSRLVDGQRLLNDREDRAMETQRILQKKEEELEEARRVIEVTKTSLKDRDEEISTRLRALASKEKDAKIEMDKLAKKEKDLRALEEELSTKERVGIQKLIDDHNTVLDAKKREFEKEMHRKREFCEEEVKRKLDAIEEEQIGIECKVELAAKREQDLDSKMEQIKIKEKDLDSKSKDLKKWEESIREGEKRLKEEKKQLGEETQDLVVSKTGLERLKAEIEAEKQQITREKENLKLTKEEREQHFLLQGKLKQEIDEYKKFKESLASESEALRHEREKFEMEWEVLDEKRMALEAEQKHLNDEQYNFEKWRHSEEERLKNEEREMKVNIHHEMEVLKLKKEAFESTIEHEGSEAHDALEKQHADIAREFAIRKHELEMNIQKKQEAMEKELRDRETEFERQRELELNHIKSSSNLNDSKVRKLKMEQDRLEREKEQLSSYAKKLESDQLEIQKDIKTLRMLSRNLKDQRQELMKEKENFLAQVAQFKVCKNCGVQISDLELLGLQSLIETEDAENILLPSLADGFFDEHLKGKNTEGSPRVTESHQANSAAPMSWLHKCSRLFNLSPGNNADSGQADKPISFGTRLDRAASEGEAGFAPAHSYEFEKDSSDTQRVQFDSDARENAELERLDNTGDEPGTSIGITENSVDITRNQSDNSIRKREDNSIPSIQHHNEMEASSLPENGSKSLSTEHRRHQPSRRAKSKMLKRTRSVQAVVEDAKAILGITSAIEKDGDSIADEVDAQNAHDESQGESLHANQLVTGGRQKRRIVYTDTEITSDLVAEDSEAHSESVSIGGRRKRRHVSTPGVQTPGEKRYNLRRSTITGSAVAAQAISDQSKGLEGNHQKTHENGLSKGDADGEGTSKHVVTTIASKKIMQFETEGIGAECGEKNIVKSLEASERSGEDGVEIDGAATDMDATSGGREYGRSGEDGVEVDGAATDMDATYGGREYGSDSGGEDNDDGDEDEEESEKHQASIGKKIFRFFIS